MRESEFIQLIWREFFSYTFSKGEDVVKDFANDAKLFRLSISKPCNNDLAFSITGVIPFIALASCNC